MCFCVILTHRRMFHKSVDFAAEDPFVKDQFVKGLQYLVDKKAQKLIYFDEKRWLLDNFRKADISRNGQLIFNTYLIYFDVSNPAKNQKVLTVQALEQ